MRSERENQALQDIVEHIALAREFTAGLSYHDFLLNAKTPYATVRCLEILSEASRRLSPELKLRNGDIDWRGVASVGNVYHHDYGKEDPASVWAAVQDELAPLLAAIEIELARPTG